MAKRLNMPNDLVEMVLTNLAEHPKDWEFFVFGGTVYDATNRKIDCKVWLANGAWGVDVHFPEVTFGGVVLVALPWSWRRRIRRAFMAAAPAANPPVDPVRVLRARLVEAA